MTSKTLTGIVLDEHVELSIQELCQACSTSTKWVIELVDEGVLEPKGHEQTHWRFSGASLVKARGCNATWASTSPALRWHST